MLSFIKKLFGAKDAESTPVPYKVETPEVKAVAETPVAKTAPKAKKPAAKKPAARKPKVPKA